VYAGKWFFEILFLLWHYFYNEKPKIRQIDFESLASGVKLIKSPLPPTIYFVLLLPPFTTVN